MGLTYISEEEAAKTLGSLMDRAALGDEFIIEGPVFSAKLVGNGYNRAKAREYGEIVANSPYIPNIRGQMK